MTNTYQQAYTPRDMRNMRVFSLWILAWIVSFTATTILMAGSFIQGPVGWTLAAVTGFLALAAVRAYMVFLRAADELLRRIQLEGLALGFGAGAVFMVCYRLFERLGAPKLDVVDPLVIMISFWCLGQYLGFRRYAGGER